MQEKLENIFVQNNLNQVYLNSKLLENNLIFFLQADKTQEAAIPELPEGIILIETVLEADVDTVYEIIHEKDSFFETIAVKNYDEVENFSMSAWQGNLSKGIDNCSNAMDAKPSY